MPLMRASSLPVSRRSQPAAGHDAAPVRIVDLRHDDAADERSALVAALRARHAAIAPKYFYDELGCALFAAICELPEYYPTRTERAIFERHARAIAVEAGTGAQLVDLGAGDCAKAESLFPVLAPARYVAVDIAADALEAALARIAGRNPALDVLGVACDFTHGLDLDAHLWSRRATFFYPGSSIGNFPPADAVAFLGDIRRHCASGLGSGLLIGVDTPKDPARLVAAYDDALGVTAAFNRNVLVHVNRILGSDFDPGAFAHVARYDAAAQRIEMHLEARRDLEVDIDGAPRRFRAGERIHTENSYKYTPEQFAGVLRAAGFDRVRVWQDGDGDFAVCYAS
jgi:dimethylhistidine N-methyltransferase